MKKEEKIALIANNKKSAQERVDEMYEQLDFYGIEPSEPVKLVNIENLTREEWLVWRRKGFGGSDAGTVTGFNHWNDMDNLWRDKRGLLKPEPNKSFKDQARLDAGHQMEPVIAKIFEGFTGYKVYSDTWMYRHSEYPWMLADVDFVAYDTAGLKVGVECKYINPDDLKYKWTSGVYGKDAKVGNLSYYVQCCHYMSVLNLDRWFLCVWGGNDANQICIIRIDRDYEFERDLIIAEHDAWETIQKGVKPVPTTKSAMAMKKLKPTIMNTDGLEETMDFVTPNEDFIKNVAVPYAEIIGDIKRYKDKIKDLEEQKDAYEVQLCDYLQSTGRKAIAMEFDKYQSLTMQYKDRNSRKFDAKKLMTGDPDTYQYLLDNGFVVESKSTGLSVSVDDTERVKKKMM